MTRKQQRSAVIELPNEREMVITRKFDAPIARVFDVFTTRDRAEMARFEGEELKVCEIDLRVGGNYHQVFVGDEGTEASFHGTFLEIEPPTRIVATWLYDGWPDAEAVESIELHETHGVTTLTYRLAFRDQAGRDHLPNTANGIVANFDNIEDLLSSRLDSQRTASE
ncbi:MAG TPA: SRPBCC domain-containing protein [Ktedonobacterales bacterium]|nr:SRPBCC domain-containing protein [Ktedonobacterales bacterium]